MVAKFLSPDREIVSRFGDCLPFSDMSLAVYSFEEGPVGMDSIWTRLVYVLEKVNF